MKAYPKSLQLRRNKNKFSAKKAVYKGRTYHSQAEAKYAEQLDWRIKAGEVISWTPQHKVELKVNDKNVGKYFVDFRVVMADGSVEFHEVKGFPTQLWRLKWEILKAMGRPEKLKLIRV